MAVSNSEGTRRCDARCYDAKDERCTCCCGGRNHGVGRTQAVENVRELVLGGAEVKLTDRMRRELRQLPLFTPAELNGA